jgi:hypothetical protein
MPPVEAPRSDWSKGKKSADKIKWVEGYDRDDGFFAYKTVGGIAVREELTSDDRAVGHALSEVLNWNERRQAVDPGFGKAANAAGLVVFDRKFDEFLKEGPRLKDRPDLQEIATDAMNQIGRESVLARF